MQKTIVFTISFIITLIVATFGVYLIVDGFHLHVEFWDMVKIALGIDVTAAAVKNVD